MTVTRTLCIAAGFAAALWIGEARAQSQGLAGRLDAETAARIAADAAEAAARQDADATLRGAVEAEASARAAGDVAERTDRQAADAALQAGISSEDAARRAADAAQQAGLSAEAAARQAADATLQAGLSAEDAARRAADAALQADLATEAAARAQGDQDTLDSATAYTDSRIPAATTRAFKLGIPGLAFVKDTGFDHSVTHSPYTGATVTGGSEHFSAAAPLLLPTGAVLTEVSCKLKFVAASGTIPRVVMQPGLYRNFDSYFPMGQQVLTEQAPGEFTMTIASFGYGYQLPEFITNDGSSYGLAVWGDAIPAGTALQIRGCTIQYDLEVFAP